MTGPLPAVPKVVRVDFHFSQTGAAAIQTREFFQYTTAMSSSDATTWVGAMATAMAQVVHDRCVTSFELVQTELTDLSSSTAPQVISGTSGSGTDASAPLAAGTAIVVRKHILRRYRGGHPRNYFGGLSESALSDPANFGPSVTAAWKTSYDAFIAACIAGATVGMGGVSHVNVSYFSGFTNHTYPSGRVKPIPTPRVSPLVDAIAATGVNTRVASQRRRNRQSA